MPCETMDKWLASGRSALIGPYHLRLIEHPCAKDKPLSSQKGQAEAFFLADERGNGWILKKFRKICRLAPSYLARVPSVLPKGKGFLCGTDRRVLEAGGLQQAKGYHYNKDLDHWLDGTILMPRVQGIDWACLADEIRDSEVTLEPARRLNLCRNLTKLVGLLEAHRCSHRDLSCGNIFIDIRTGEVCLIDFDSLFHPSLPMPEATTCGTEGYTAPYMWINGSLDPRTSWCEGADRYALALLNVEMLMVDGETEATGEGGIFSQQELKNRSGKGIDSIVAELRVHYPGAAELLLQAVNSRRATDCPSPQDWDDLFRTVPAGTAGVPTLSSLPDFSDRIEDLLARSRPAAPLWPAPSLSEVPIAIPKVPARRSVARLDLELPPDPWAQNPGEPGRMTRRPAP